MKRLFLIIAAVCAVSTVSAQEMLSMNLHKGQVFNQKTVNSSVITQNVMGQMIDTQTNSETVVRYEVVGESDNGYDLSVTYVEMQNSNGTDNPTATALMETMLGKPFEITIRKDGKITDVRGMDEVFAGMSSVEGMPPEVAAEIKKMMENTFGGDAAVSNMQNNMVVYPDKPVAVGHKWSVESTQSVIGLVMTTTNNFTYKGEQDGCRIIEVESVLETNSGKMEMMGVVMNMDLAGTTVGELKVDPKTGWVISSSQLMDMSGTVGLEESPQMPMSITIPMTIKGEVTVVTE